MKTMKHWPNFGKFKDKPCILNSKFTGNVQLNLGEKGYYIEVSNSKRGAMAKVNEPIVAYDIATCPGKDSVDYIKNGYLQIIRQKILNDIEIFRCLVKKLLDDKLVDSSSSISIEDVIDILLDHEKYFTKEQNENVDRMIKKVTTIRANNDLKD